MLIRIHRPAGLNASRLELLEPAGRLSKASY